VSLFQFVGQYFWLLALAAIGYEHVAARRSLAAREDLDADAAAELNEYLRNFTLVTSIPWLIMGAGQIVGSTPSVWYYFRPQDRNPFVLAWHGSIFLESVLYAYWVLLAGGAKKSGELFKVLGYRQTVQISEFWMKVLAAIVPFLDIGCVYWVALANVPVPR
jgi:hypothetical protein